MCRRFFHLLTAFLIALLFVQPIAAVSGETSRLMTVKSATKERRRKDAAIEKTVARRRGDEGKKTDLIKASLKEKPAAHSAKVKLPDAPAELEGQTATLLADGNWLLLGGRKDEQTLRLAAIKDAASGQVTELSNQMLTARAGHTATTLPNGKILILGGRGENKATIAQAELFDPETRTFEPATITKATTSRAEHTATLLPSGWLLIAGGVGANNRLVETIELIDADKLVGRTLKARMQILRRGHTSSLEPDGTVFLQNGFDQNDLAVEVGETFEPESQVFSVGGGTAQPNEAEEPRIAFSNPINGATDVSLNARPVLRFSKPLDVKTINRQTVTLSGAEGEIAVKLTAAENGKLLFVTPQDKLKVESQYFLRLAGVRDNFNLSLPEIVLAFKTEAFCNDPATPAGTPPSAMPLPRAKAGGQLIDEDSYLPGDPRFKQKEASKKADEPPPLEAGSKVTALAGRVLSISDKPLAGVTLELAGQTAVTDSNGRFLLAGLPAGQRGLVIHGETVNSPGKTFASFEVLVDVDEGKTNKLPYTIFLPVLDKQNEVALTTPTASETVVTSSRVPGMEVRIARDAVLKMPSGHGMSHRLTNMNANHEMMALGITAIPMERPPFPLPQGMKDGLLFTLQMHGAKVEGPHGEKRPGLRFTFPNALQQEPGTRVSFWNYDSTKAGWTWYGDGTVTKDGTRVVPDPGVELEGMQCLSLMGGAGHGYGPKPGSHGFDGDPVDLQTGLFTYEQTDLVLPDTIPIKLTRTYRQNGAQLAFGVGATHPFNLVIQGDTHNYGNLVLPDGTQIKFVRDHSNANEWVAYHTETPTAYYKAEMRYLTYPHQIDFEGGGWEILLRDGTRMIFARRTIHGDILGIHVSQTALHQIIDRWGNKLTVTRDNLLRLNRVVSPNNKWIEFAYEGTSEIVTQVRDSAGRTVNYTYENVDSSARRLIKVTDVEGGETHYTYDASHRMLTLKDANGTVNLTNEYDANGRVKKQTAADGTVYQYAYTYDSQGTGRTVQTDVTNPRGLVRRMIFNEKGYPTSEIFGVGRSDAWSYTYERDPTSNRVLGITDAWNQKTKFAYDAHGNVLSSTYLEGTANAVTTSATYTAFDNVASTTDALARTVNFTYNERGELTKTKDWLNREASLTYNSAGQVLTTTDPVGRTSKFRYEKGALVEAEDPLGRRSRQFVDAAGRATRTYDTLGRATQFRFNKQNRPTSMIDPLGRTGALKYDRAGNILEITDSRGGQIKYTYDNMGRPLSRTDQLNRVESYSYDAFGNLHKALDKKNQTTEFSYDVFNRPTLVKYGDASTTAYAYDAKGRVSSVTDSAGGTITYGYDALDRVNKETTAAGSIDYSYDAGGRLISMKAPGQSIITYAYDTADRVQSITQDSQVVSFGYDTADRRTAMTLPNGIVVSYTYDTASQLKAMTYKRGTTTLGDVAFEYDAQGRRTHVSGSLAQQLSPTLFNTAVYDAANQQKQVGAQSLTFDANGNLTADGYNTYSWNARDELTGISGAGLTATFKYDGEGRRISKTINGTTTTYTYDGLQAIEERQTAGPTTTNLAGGLDEVFLRKSVSGTTTKLEYLLTDALGSTWGLADGTGNVTTQYKYDVFGQTQMTGAASTNPLQYTGRENDSTGLYYYRNRYYSPALRRFISADPLREAAGENEYAYVNNSPTNFTDALGLYPGEGGGYNALNDMGVGGRAVSWYLDGDQIARDSWTVGNYCAPLSDRMWAGARLGWTIISNVFGAKIISKAFGLLGKGGAAIFKRIPCNNFTSRFLGKSCFVKGTLIHTREGLKPIEELKANEDEVLSYNEQTRQTEYKPIIETYVRQTKEIIKLHVAGEAAAIETTAEHPFYVRVHRARDGLAAKDDEDEIGEWREAGSLQVGDEVRSANGEWTCIVAVEREQRSETVYNFAVEGNHNYFVGEQGSLVHNSCVQSRINLANGPTRFTPLRQSGNPISAGWQHVLDGHFNRSLANNRSIFSVAPDQLKSILQSPNVVRSPVTLDPTGTYVRIADAGQIVGNASLNHGGVPTSMIKIFTDRMGNLITAFPVP